MEQTEQSPGGRCSISSSSQTSRDQFFADQARKQELQHFVGSSVLPLCRRIHPTYRNITQPYPTLHGAGQNASVFASFCVHDNRCRLDHLGSRTVPITWALTVSQAHSLPDRTGHDWSYRLRLNQLSQRGPWVFSCPLWISHPAKHVKLAIFKDR